MATEFSHLDLRTMAPFGDQKCTIALKLPSSPENEQELLEFIAHVNKHENSAVCSPCQYTLGILDRLVSEGKLICMDSINPDYPNAAYSYVCPTY